MGPVLPAYLAIGDRKVNVVHPEDPFSSELCVEMAVLKKTMNEEIIDFMKNWSTAQIIDKYIQTRPHVNQQVLKDLLTANPTFALYAGEIRKFLVDLIFSFL